MKLLEDLFDIDTNPIDSIIGTKTCSKLPWGNNDRVGYISNVSWNKSTKTGSITLDAQYPDEHIRIDSNFIELLKNYYVSYIDCNNHDIDTFNTSVINPKFNLTIDNCDEFIGRCVLENVTIKSKVLNIVENFGYKNCNIDVEECVQISTANYTQKYMLNKLQIPFINCKIKTKKLKATFVGYLQHYLDNSINKNLFCFEKTFNIKGWDVDIYEFYFVDDYGSTRLFATKNKSNTKGWFEYKKSKDNYYYRIGNV